MEDLIKQFKILAQDYYKKTGILINYIHFNELGRSFENVIYELSIQIKK
jgi:hypothetical protein